MVRRLRWLGILFLVGFICWLGFPRGHEIEPLRPVSGSKSDAGAFNNYQSSTKAAEGVLPLTASPRRRARVVYPYSVIPGGVRSTEELQNAIANDPVVSVHYAAFHLSSARIIQLDRDRFMHVSYRLGNKVYWTKRELRLAKGEMLITDGIQTARTRCGNLISTTVLGSVGPNEPTPKQLDTPQIPPDTDIQISSNREDIPGGPLWTQIAGAIVPPAGEVSPPAETVNYPVTPVPPGPPETVNYPVIIGPPSGPGVAPWPSPPGPTRIVSVPEPATVILLLIGLFAVVMLLWRKVQASRSES